MDINDLAGLADRIDPALLGLMAAVALGCLWLIVLVRRLAETGHGLRADTERLTERLAAREGEAAQLAETLAAREAALRTALARADRAEVQAEERRAETARQAGEIAGLRQRLEAGQGERQELASRIAALDTRMSAERRHAEEKIALLTTLRDEMQAKFRDLAGEALKTQGEAFGKANLERLEAVLTPLREHVGLFGKELREVHQETVKDRERLKTEIAQLSRRSEEISQEAVALTRALKGDRQRQGAWGEMILESILERSGLRAGEEYETQAHRTGAEGARLRPDVVVRIPGGRTLVIDAKVSLSAYSEAVNTEAEAEAAAARRRHQLAMRAHIDGLSAKGYHTAEGETVDYVIMFVPVEGALSEALREDGALTEYALERHITIATPTTLMMALRTVAHVWAVERRNRNAEEIALRAGRLYDKVAGFVASIEGVGRRLDQARTSYDEAIGQLSRGRGNVLSQVDMLKTLGARVSKTIAMAHDGEEEEEDAPARLGRDGEDGNDSDGGNGQAAR
ncbi:MAG: DNA recombination protein RmuC [Gemmobacter sp.]